MKKASLTPGSLFDGLPTADRFHVYPKTRTREDVIKENEKFLKRLERLENVDVKKRSAIYGPWEWTEILSFLTDRSKSESGNPEGDSHSSDDPVSAER